MTSGNKDVSFKADTLMTQFYDAKQVEALADIHQKRTSAFHGEIQSPLSQLVRTFKAIADENCSSSRRDC